MLEMDVPSFAVSPSNVICMHEYFIFRMSDGEGIYVKIKRLDPTAAPGRTPADARSGSDMKFCSEML